MDFFNRFGDTVNKAAEATGKTAKLVAEIARLNYENIRKRDEMRKAYTAIGKTYVQMKGDDPDEAMAVDVAAVYAAEAAIAENKVRIEELKQKLHPENAEEDMEDEEFEDTYTEEGLPEIEVEIITEDGETAE